MKTTTSQQKSGKKSQSSTTKSKPNSVRLTEQQARAFHKGEGIFLEDHTGEVIGLAGGPARPGVRISSQHLDVLADIEAQLEFISVAVGSMSHDQELFGIARLGLCLTLDQIQHKVQAMLN